MRDGIVNNSALAVSALVGLFLVPLMFHGLGVEAYGLWVGAVSLSGLASAIDLGIPWNLTRRIASARGNAGDVSLHVGSALLIFMTVTVFGVAVVVLAWTAVMGSIAVAGPTPGLIVPTALMLGMAFLADQLLAFAVAVLHGFRRFHASNAVLIQATLVRAAAIAAVLIWTPTLGWVFAGHAVASGIAAGTAMWTIARLEPRLRLHADRRGLRALFSDVPFFLGSQALTVTDRAIWQGGALLVGVLLGPAAIASFYLGQRLPSTFTAINGRLSSVLFPIAAASNRSEAYSQELLRVATRWVLVLALPAMSLAFLLAPQFLLTWIGDAPADVVLVMRLMALAVLADAGAAAALHILWGQGAVGIVVKIAAGVATTAVVVGAGLVQAVGITGAAWALLLALSAGWLLFFFHAGRSFGVQGLRLLASTVIGLVPPTVACVLSASVAVALAPTPSSQLVGGLILGGLAYLVVFYVRTARPEERLLARSLMSAPIPRRSR